MANNNDIYNAIMELKEDVGELKASAELSKGYGERIRKLENHKNTTLGFCAAVGFIGGILSRFTNIFK